MQTPKRFAKGMQTFRLVTSLLFLFSKGFPFGETLLGASAPLSFMMFCFGYFLYAILLETVFKDNDNWSPFGDVFFLLGFLHESGGCSSGLGYLLLFPVVGVGVSWESPKAFGFAGFLSIVVLISEAFLFDSSLKGVETAGYISVSMFFMTYMGIRFGRELDALSAKTDLVKLENKKISSVAANVLDEVGEALVIQDADGFFMNSLGRKWLSKTTDFSSIREGHVIKGGCGDLLCKKLLSDNSSTIWVFSLVSDFESLAREMKLKSLGLLVSNVAHEIRNPLSGIRQSIDLMREDGVFDERLSSIAIRNVERINSIVSMLSGKPDYRKLETINIKQFIRDFVDISFINKEKVFSVSGDDKEIHLSPSVLEKSLGNLLKNAFNFSTKENGSVSVSIENTSYGCLVRVKDDGVGVCEEMRDRLFEPFSSKGTNGMGLGLFLAKESLLSSGQGKIHHLEGSVFEIEFYDATK